MKIALLALALAGCATAEYKAATAESASSEVAQLTSTPQNEIQLQGPCGFGFPSNAGELSKFGVCALTKNGIFFIAFNKKQRKLILFKKINIKDIKGVAFATFFTNREVQVKTNTELMGFQIAGENFVDKKTTSKAYELLVAYGGKPMEEQNFIYLIAPPEYLVIPIYIRR